MRQSELTENLALNGMIKLFKFTEEPRQVNVKLLSEKSGLPVAKISVLKQQGILVCQPVKDGGRGRKFQWVWEGHRPNMHMAKKLVDTTPDYPSQNPKSSKPTPEVVVEKKEEKKLDDVLRSRVVQHRTLEITKRLNSTRVDLLVAKSGDGNITLETEINTGTTSADELRCWGVAFLTAADELSKE